jgi:mannose-6-phosphate isomerase
MHPLKFTPIYKEKIWGGRAMEKIGKSLPDGKIGESWELSDTGDDVSIVSEGPFAGKNLRALLKDHRAEILGPRLAALYADRFPLLFKFIDANDRLSIQVHPDDVYARSHENGSFGKTECWYVCDARPGACIIAGLSRKTTPEEFEKALKSNIIEEYVRKIRVKKGDMFFIPAGRIHAIMPGLLINEIQQNSDITYRVYDWNRLDDSGKPRALHVRQSLETINFDDTGVIKQKPKKVDKNTEVLVQDKYFTVQKIAIRSSLELSTRNEDSFHVLSIIEGQGRIEHSGEDIGFTQGESLFVPHASGAYRIKPEGETVLLKTHIS